MGRKPFPKSGWPQLPWVGKDQAPGVGIRRLMLFSLGQPKNEGVFPPTRQCSSRLAPQAMYDHGRRVGEGTLWGNAVGSAGRESLVFTPLGAQRFEQISSGGSFQSAPTAIPDQQKLRL